MSGPTRCRRPVPTCTPRWDPHYVRLLRNPYFHEWSHAAQPDGYPDQIVFHTVTTESQALAAVERGSADYAYQGVPPDRLNELQTRFPSRLYVNPLIATDALVLNTRAAPFDDIRVRRAVNYAIDRARVARLLGQASRRTCQLLPPYLPGYQRYCPYTVDPNPAGIWHGPEFAKAERLIAASHTRGTPVTIWNLGAYQTDFTPIEPYLVSLLDRLDTRPRSRTCPTTRTPGPCSPTPARGRKPPSPSSSRSTPPRLRSSKSTSHAKASCQARRVTQTFPSSATRNSTRRSRPPSQPKATTRQKPRRYGRRLTEPPPTRPRLSRWTIRATSTSSQKGSATTNTASPAGAYSPTSSGSVSSARTVRVPPLDSRAQRAPRSANWTRIAH